MTIRFKQRELIEIDPIDLEPKKALGVKIPFRSTGSPFELNYTTKDQVKSNLLNLLLTNPGERFNEPLFGVGISQQLFKQNISEEDLQSTITTQTELFVPEVSVENIEITQGPLKGEKLTIENFETWKNGLMDDALTNVGQLHIETIRSIAKELGIQHDADYEFNFDKPFKIADVSMGDKIINTDSDYHEISQFLKLRAELEDAGLIETMNVPESAKLKLELLKNDGDTKDLITGNIKAMLDTLRYENYGENYPEDILPNSNAFIFAL